MVEQPRPLRSPHVGPTQMPQLQDDYHRLHEGHNRAHHLMEEGPGGERDEDIEPHEEEHHEEESDNDMPLLLHEDDESEDDESEDDLPPQHAPAPPAAGNQGPQIFG